MLSLRPYQQEAVRKAVRFLRSNNPEPSLIVLPTGWGKSVLTAYAAKYIDANDSLLVVQPSKELLEQNYAKYTAMCDDESEKASIYSASLRRKEIGRITYATIGSIKSMGARFREMGFTRMLIDEAHLYPRAEESMLGQFLADSGIRCVLGITATPLKLESFSEKNGETLDKWSQLTMLTNPSPDGTFFQRIIHLGQISEMTEGHYWSPLLYECLPFNPSELRFNTTGSDFSKDSDERAYALNHVRENIYAALNHHSERRHCVVFVPSVEEAGILSQGYPSSAVVSAATSVRERRQIIEDFRQGRLRVLFNVSIAGTGFDYPGIDMIILATSMASVGRYYQFLGRGVRRDEYKTNCLICDMGGNVDRFGHIEEISYEYDGKWRMYGAGNQLLTGLPIRCLGHVSKTDILRASHMNPHTGVMTWGKHKGKSIDAVPVSYKVWYLTQPHDGPAQVTAHLFLRSLEERVRDTRAEPEMQFMPTGQYAGKPFDEIPRGYLAWFYNAQTWNETNDALRRAVERAYGGVPRYFVRQPKSPAGKKTTTAPQAKSITTPASQAESNAVLFPLWE